MVNKRKVGSNYEQIASEYLLDHGYTILVNNYHCKFGELDIIAKKDDIITFVEVKYRKTKSMVDALESVGYRKQVVISKCAKYFLTVSRLLNQACQFDVIGFDGEELVHIKNAFEYIGR